MEVEGYKVKRLVMMLVTFLVALSVLVGCNQSNNGQNTNPPVGTEEKKTINDYVTIKDEFNKEMVSPSGPKVHYIYKVPVLNIDKPGAKKINEMFLKLEKDIETRLADGQLMPGIIESKAFLNGGTISLVMDIKKSGPGGITVANYDIQKDKEVSTKELLEKYKFDPQKLIAEINKQAELDKNRPDEDKEFIAMDNFVDTILNKMYPNGYLQKSEEMKNKTKEEKERFVVENIDKLQVFANKEGKLVFIYFGELPDEEFVVE